MIAKKTPIVIGPTRPDTIRRNVALQEARHRLNIEGEMVTLSEIATRIGRSRSWTHKRYTKLKALPGAITWTALRGDA